MRNGPEPDRVLATVMFTDIVGSTEHVAKLGDRRWRNVLDRYYDETRKYLTIFRGREGDTAGDGFFATFNGPARGIRCACAIRNAVTDLGIAIRAGLHTGECEVVGDKVPDWRYTSELASRALRRRMRFSLPRPSRTSLQAPALDSSTEELMC